MDAIISRFKLLSFRASAFVQPLSIIALCILMFVTAFFSIGIASLHQESRAIEASKSAYQHAKGIESAIGHLDQVIDEAGRDRQIDIPTTSRLLKDITQLQTNSVAIMSEYNTTTAYLVASANESMREMHKQFALAELRDLTDQDLQRLQDSLRAFRHRNQAVASEAIAWHDQLQEQRAAEAEVVIWVTSTFCLLVVLVWAIPASLRRTWLEELQTRTTRRLIHLQVEKARYRSLVTAEREQSVDLRSELEMVKRDADQSHLLFLRASRRLQTVITGLPIACFAFNRSGLVTDWNTESAKVFGIEAERAKGLAPHEAVRTHEIHALVAGIKVVLGGESIEHAKITIYDAQGELRQVIYSAYPTYDEQGETSGGIVAAMDVTDRENAIQEALMATSQRAAILEQIDHAFIAVDRAFNLEFANPTAQNLLGLESGLQNGISLPEFLPDEIFLAFQNALERSCNEGAPVRFEIHRSSTDQWLDVRIFPGKSTISILFDDITQRVQEVARLSESESTFRAALEAMHDGVIIVSKNGLISTINHRASEILECDAVQAKGHRIEKVVPTLFDFDNVPLVDSRRPIAKARRGHHVANLQVFITTRSGQRKFLSVNASPIQDSSGSSNSVIVTFRDDTELMNSERELTERLSMYETAVERIRQQSNRLKVVENRLSSIMYADSLSGLPNTRALNEDWKHAGGFIGKHFVLFGVNEMAAYNKNQGQVQGDRALQTIATCLRAVVTEADKCYRLRGDEFVVITDDGSSVAERFHAKMLEAQWFSSPVTVSHGHSEIDEERTLRDVYGEAQIDRKGHYRLEQHRNAA